MEEEIAILMKAAKEKEGLSREEESCGLVELLLKADLLDQFFGFS